MTESPVVPGRDEYDLLLYPSNASFIDDPLPMSVNVEDLEVFSADLPRRQNWRKSAAGTGP